MSISFHTGVSGWWLLLFILASLLLSFLLYRKRNIEPSWAKWVLFSLRTVGIFLLLFLLLDPVITRKIRKEEKPFLVLAIDRSKSVTTLEDSTQTFWENTLKAFKDELETKYRVAKVYFGGGISFENDSTLMPWQTDMGTVLEFVQEAYAQRGKGKLVVFSDGIVNKGINPQFIPIQKNLQIYTVGLGDTLERADAKAVAIFANEAVPIGTDFMLEADLVADALKGKTLQVLVKLDGATIRSESWLIEAERAYKRVSAIIPAKIKGFHKISVEISARSEEFNKRNNSIERYIEFIENSSKIALVYEAPHPDIGTIKWALESEGGKRVFAFSAEEARKVDWTEYDAVILHQIPTQTAHVQILEAIKNNGNGCWMILGSKTHTPLFNRAKLGVNLESKGRIAEMRAVPNLVFSEFELDALNLKRLSMLPPLKGPFGEIETGGDYKNMVSQSINGIETDQTLWGVGYNGKTRVAYTFGEGIWKWRQREYAQYDGADGTLELINKTVQYIITRNSKKRLNVYTQRRDYGPESQVVFQGEYLNVNGVQENTKEIQVSLTRKGAQKKVFNLGKSGKGYRIDLGTLPSGEYRYLAEVKGEPGLIDEGVFSVSEVSVELSETSAKHDVLKQMALNGNGTFHTQKQWKKLLSVLNQPDQSTPILYTEKADLHLLQNIWMYISIICVFGMEWLLRKWLTGSA